jgi:hypothetical protein
MRKRILHFYQSILFAICYFRAKLIVRRVRLLLDPLGLQPVCTKSNTWETGLLNLLFKNTDFTEVGDAGGLRGSATANNLYFSLHTADPGEGGDQTTSETAYTGYARKDVARGAGFTVTGNSVSPAANVDFGECTASPGSPIQYFGIGTASSGAGKLLYSGAVTPNITMAVGVIPRIKSTSTITED